MPSCNQENFSSHLEECKLSNEEKFGIGELAVPPMPDSQAIEMRSAPGVATASVSTTCIATSVAAASITQAVGHGGKGVDKVVAQRAEDADDGNRNQSGDQTVFDSGCAAIVLEKVTDTLHETSLYSYERGS